MNQENEQDDKVIEEQERLFEEKMKNKKKTAKVKKTGQQFDSANHELKKQLNKN